MQGRRTAFTAIRQTTSPRHQRRIKEKLPEIQKKGKILCGRSEEGILG
jgi:hypothetical protein